MFYYKSNKKTAQLEVSIQQSLTEMDFEHILFFIEAFIEDSNDMVVFNELPELHEHIQNVIDIHNQQFLNYNIIINVA